MNYAGKVEVKQQSECINEVPGAIRNEIELHQNINVSGVTSSSVSFFQLTPAPIAYPF
jgi:hypothetical protein